MKKLFLTLLILLLPAWAWGANYCVKPTGTVTIANKATAIISDMATCTAAANAAALNMAQVNAATAGNAFAAGSTVYFSAKDGSGADANYTTALTWPTSGTNGNIITYQGIADGTGATYPTITVNGTPVIITSMSYIAMKGFTVTNTSASAAVSAVRVNGTTASNSMTFEDLAVSAPNSSASYGINCTCPYTDVLANRITASGTSGMGIYFSGNPSTNVSVANSTISATGGIHIKSATNVVVTGNTIAAVGTEGIWIDTCAGTISQSGNRITSAAANGAIYYNASTLNGTVGNEIITGSSTGGLFGTGLVGPVTFSNISVNGVTGVGFKILGASSNLVFSDCTATNGGNDGFAVNDSTHDVKWSRCKATGNGNKLTTSDGDGFTAHLTNYNIYVEECIAANNTASGFGMVGTSSGHIYNSVAYHNAGDWSVEGGEKLNQIRGGFFFDTTAVNPTTGVGWTMRNNIGVGNYPVEVGLTVSSKNLVDFDYNDYQETTAANFATLDTLTSKITWEAYASRETHSLHVDPLFKSATDYRLKSSSPCKNAGVNVGLTTDFIGKPIRGLPDIGAYELQPVSIGGGFSLNFSGGF